MKNKIGSAVLFLFIASGIVFGQTKELTCTRNTYSDPEVQLTLDEIVGTAFLHANQATHPSPAEFTSDFISWQSTFEAHQADRSYITRTYVYKLNRHTGTLETNGRPDYSCSVSERKL